MGFHTIRNGEGGLFLTPGRRVEMTNAIGIFSKSGRYGGGIFSHKDIVFEFGTWRLPNFNIFLSVNSNASKTKKTTDYN